MTLAGCCCAPSQSLLWKYFIGSSNWLFYHPWNHGLSSSRLGMWCKHSSSEITQGILV